MASLDRSLPAGRTRVSRRGWNEYLQLSRQLKQAGLLERRRGWYGARIGLNLVLLAAGGVGFFVLGESWWQLAVAAYLAVVFAQLGFLGHDAGHQQIFPTRRRNDLLGLMQRNLLIGLSYVVDRQAQPPPRHPNDVDLRPRHGRHYRFYAAQARRKHGAPKFVARHQAACSSRCCCFEAATCTWQHSLAAAQPGRPMDRGRCCSRPT